MSINTYEHTLNSRVSEVLHGSPISIHEEYSAHKGWWYEVRVIFIIFNPVQNKVSCVANKELTDDEIVEVVNENEKGRND